MSTSPPNNDRRSRGARLILQGAREHDHGLRWAFRFEHPSLKRPVLLAVYTSWEGRYRRHQQVGAEWEEVDLPASLLDVIRDRVQEEIARTQIAALFVNHMVTQRNGHPERCLYAI